MIFLQSKRYHKIALAVVEWTKYIYKVSIITLIFVLRLLILIGFNLNLEEILSKLEVFLLEYKYDYNF